MLFFSRWWYYLTSIPTLLFGVQNWWAMLQAFLGLPIETPFILTLRNGDQFYVRTRMDIWVIKETCLDRDYERYGEAVQDGWTVVDIGGALGDFTITTARKYPQAQVYVFEPFPESYELLQKNIALNKVHNVHAFNIAIASESGELHLAIESGVAVMHSTAQSTSDQRIRVESKTLGQFMTEQNIPQIDLLKIDAEGAEYDILLNLDLETLHRIKRISMEYHDNLTPHTHVELVQFLEDHGFIVKTNRNPAHEYIGFLFAS